MSKINKILIGFCLLGLVVRTLYIILFNPGITWPDESRFWEEATNFAQQGTIFSGDRYAHDMPLTALLMGVFIKFFGLSVLGIKILLAFISSATIFLIGKTAYRLFPADATVWLAGCSSAFYPFFIYYASLILSETIFLFLVCFFFYSLFILSEKKTVLTGFWAGLTQITRPTILGFMPIVWLWQYFEKKISWRMITLSAVIFFSFSIAWGIRNYITLRGFLLTTSGSSQVLWEGNNPWNETGGVSEESWKYLEAMPQNLNEIDRARWKSAQAKNYILNNLGRFFELAIKKFFRFWHLWPNFKGFNRGLYQWIALISFGPLLFLSILSLWGLKEQWRLTMILWLFFAYYTALHMITIGSIRYRLPLEPLMIVLSSALIAKYWIRIKRALINKRTSCSLDS
jgi:hypothetical protein